MKRGGNLKRGRRKPRTIFDRDHWQSAWQLVCAVCGTRPTDTLHHVIKAQHVRSKGGDEWCPDNALPICQTCHDDHHSGSAWRIPVQALLRVNREFARDLLGEADQDYFGRYYGLTERLEVLSDGS